MEKASSNVFYGSVCHVCKQFSPNLRRCVACKTLAYCSKDHQKLDWPQHKSLCRAIAYTNSCVSYKIGCSLEEWKRYRLELNRQWKCFLKRELLPHECQMWMFPRVCAVCFSKNDLQDCVECLSVAYCSSAHQETQKNIHSRLCGKLKLCLDTDRYLLHKKLYPTLRCVPHLNERVAEFPSNMKKVMKNLFNDDHFNDCEYVLKTDISTTFSTIAHAINTFRMYTKENNLLVMHVVGAASFEAFTDWKWVSINILHCFPNVNTIEWILIGPEAENVPSDTETACSLCTANKRSYTVKTHKELYENVVDQLPIPDLVIALNSGIHEFKGSACDSWKRGISSLLKYSNVPLLLTAYTEQEILEDLRCIADCISVKVLMEAQVNSYASLRPLRDWADSTTAVSIFYVNGYVAAVSKNAGV